MSPFALGLGEFVGERAPIFGHRLAARLANRGDGRLRCVQMALLNAEFLLLLDQQLEGFEIGELRAQLLFHERLADVDARLDDRDHGFELMDGGRGRGLLGLLLRLLTVERAELGAVLGHLVEQELTLSAQQCRVCFGGRREVGERIVPGGERRAQPRDVELLGEEVAAQVIAFRGVYGRIELDQHVTGLDRLPVVYPNGAHNAGLERLDDLGAAARHDFSARRRDDVDRAPPGPYQRRAEQQDDGGRDRTADWRRWRFHDFKRRRQERQLFAAPCVRAPKGDDGPCRLDRRGGFSGLHGCLPASDATMHNGRRS